ncbi:unnamed protein product [Nyctereutes procyonoides]|uniref:(raccoon dog) hypothetical protein n=1 Tax=Nyctereutes procyonoides TaxID=34880 RepID=A0A811YGP7_NYCPR|nr:unnamed protein product [Nyctereutes procyonoides]
MDYMWEEEDEEEDLDYYLGDVEEDLRGEDEEDEEEVLEEDEEEELPLPPPPAPRRCLTCPRCRKSPRRRSFRPNLQLTNMVRVIRQMHPSPGRGSKQGICPKHQEALKLFCKVDEEAICARLQGHVQPLGTPPEAVQKMKAEEERRLTELKIRRLTRFLAQEQAGLERRPQECRSSWATCWRGPERSQQGTLNSCEEVRLQPPEVWSPDPGQPHSHDFLTDAIVRKMSPIPDAVPCPPGAGLAERRQEVPDHSNLLSRLLCPGGPRLPFWLHSWEAEVGGPQGWAVGAARESTHQKEQVGSGGSSVGSGDASSARHRHRHRRLHLPQQPLPQRQVRCVGTNGKRYEAQSSTQQTSLSPSEKPRRSGVYLDCEAGRLGFYNAETLAHVHTFSAAFLGKPVFPFFPVLSKGTPIKLCLD